MLIPLEITMFMNYKTYEELIKTLDKIFEEFIAIKTEEFITEDWYKIVYTTSMEEKDLVEVAKHFVNEDTGLIESKLIQRGNHAVYREICRRYGSISKFATKVNLGYTRKHKGAWNEEEIIKGFLSMYKSENRILNSKEIKDSGNSEYTKLLSACTKTRSNQTWEKNRFKFYKYCLDNKIKLNEYEIQHIKKMTNSNLSINESVNLGYTSNHKGAWSEEEIIKGFISMYTSEKRILNTKEIRKCGNSEYTKLLSACTRPKYNQTWEKNRFRFYKYCLNNNIRLNKHEIEHIKKITNNTLSIDDAVNNYLHQ